MSESTVVSAVEAILGTTGVKAWNELDEGLVETLGPALKAGTAPAAIAYPPTQAELAAIMACAHRQGWRVLVCGHGSKLDWGGYTAVDLVISTERLNRLIEHAVGDLTVTVEAGMGFYGLQQKLAQANQFLAIDPAYPEIATIGGIVATGDTGALRQRYGSVRDMLIGVAFVRHDGAAVKAGGRVVKNVAGYDLMKLMTGSYGSLGAITQLTFRTYPLQEASQTVVFTGDPATIEQLFKAVRRSPLTPIAFDIMTPALAQTEQVALAVRFQSLAVGVEEQVQRVLEMGSTLSLTGKQLSGPDDERFWRRAARDLWDSSLVAKVGINPAMAVSWLVQLGSRSVLARVHSRGVGLVQLSPAVTAAEIEDLRASLQPGYVTLLKAPPRLRQEFDLWGYSGDALPVMQAIKAQFDPQRRLSPGRFVGGI